MLSQFIQELCLLDASKMTKGNQESIAEWLVFAIESHADLNQVVRSGYYEGASLYWWIFYLSQFEQHTAFERLKEVKPPQPIDYSATAIGVDITWLAMRASLVRRRDYLYFLMDNGLALKDINFNLRGQEGHFSGCSSFWLALMAAYNGSFGGLYYLIQGGFAHKNINFREELGDERTYGIFHLMLDYVRNNSKRKAWENNYSDFILRLIYQKPIHYYCEVEPLNNLCGQIEQFNSTDEFYESLLSLCHVEGLFLTNSIKMTLIISFLRFIAKQPVDLSKFILFLENDINECLNELDDPGFYYYLGLAFFELSYIDNAKKLFALTPVGHADYEQAQYQLASYYMCQLDQCEHETPIIIKGMKHAIAAKSLANTLKYAFIFKYCGIHASTNIQSLVKQYPVVQMQPNEATCIKDYLEMMKSCIQNEIRMRTIENHHYQETMSLGSPPLKRLKN